MCPPRRERQVRPGDFDENEEEEEDPIVEVVLEEGVGEFGMCHF